MKRKYFYITTTLLFIILLLYSVDFKVNSKFFIKKQINKAFTKRKVGDCEGLNQYLLKNKSIKSNDTTWYLDSSTYRWKIKDDISIHCECEKLIPINITQFEIKDIEYTIGSDDAFVNIEITRNSGKGKKNINLVSYHLQRVNNIWKIRNENNEYMNYILNN
jgi:hypothetical protein